LVVFECVLQVCQSVILWLGRRHLWTQPSTCIYLCASRFCDHSLLSVSDVWHNMHNHCHSM